ncbi:hypothetical protein EDB85DRAFT_2227420 [Lactarius pseudohatsudake]|nr:hypothetical protein EDB85DRAFT_2227420 [Lactarius pseudohatsudake]
MGLAAPRHRLPPSFTSLYRLLLRTSSAAVLHHKAATRYVRTLWKPTFYEAGTVIHRLQVPTLATAEKAQLERWLCLWESSVDRTLSLLSTSAQSRGLAHKLTRNLAFLNFGFRRYQESIRSNSTRSWEPHQQEYKPPRDARSSQIKAEKFDSQCWGALEETVRMAEGKSRLSLGRIALHRRRA